MVGNELLYDLIRGRSVDNMPPLHHTTRCFDSHKPNRGGGGGGGFSRPGNR